MRVLSSKQFGQKLKATIQSSGKLGFSKITGEVLELNKCQCVKFAQDDDSEGTLYLAAVRDTDEDGFGILQSGGYYNVSTKPLFDALGVDYSDQTMIYDLTRCSSLDHELGGSVYKMTPRPIIKTKLKNMER